MVKSWEQLGKRVMAARKEQGLTQDHLATELRVERTAITKIEAGQRRVDSLELAKLAKLLRRPIDWFVIDPPPSVVSRRESRQGQVRREDIELEALARDVEQLVELGLLTPPAAPPAVIDSIAAAEQAALDARRAAELSDDAPVWDLLRVVERLGLYAFVLQLDGSAGAQAEGSYIALRQGGVALVTSDNAPGTSGRRRFTIAHELGHHVLADEYAPEWIVGAGESEREKVISAFAIHFLMPRIAVEQRWLRLKGRAEPRDAAIRIAVEFGMSWSAACAQLHRFGCLSNAQHDELSRWKPTSIDYVERELSIRDDVCAPLVPPGYAAAVARALKRGKIGATRALELLHGTVHERDLPPEKPLSLEAMTAELEPLPE